MLSSWFFTKYISPWKAPPQISFVMWKNICETTNISKKHFTFKITKDCPISLKCDHWCNANLLLDMHQYHSLTSLLPNNFLLSQFFNASGWKIPSACHKTVLDSIRSIPILLREVLSICLGKMVLRLNLILICKTIIRWRMKFFGIKLCGINIVLYGIQFMSDYFFWWP